ncbi:hypothetical protein KKI22_00505 [Patescibacteria group bacterium]|nr:hypothetical protein [Patescibacteria group bacterium]
MFSSSDPGKYPTIGKFLPSTNKQQAVFPAASTKADDQKEDQNDLDLLDQLVSQTILNRVPAPSTDQAPQVASQGTARAKEFLANQVATESPIVNAEVNTEATAESTTEAALESAPEALVSPEVAELSKELKEVSSETKEQREQAAIKEKQQEINNLAATVTTPVAVSDKPVVVLPITAKSKEEAKFKSTKYSVKWLVEWCIKVAKMFSGAVIYKEEIADE